MDLNLSMRGLQPKTNGLTFKIWGIEQFLFFKRIEHFWGRKYIKIKFYNKKLGVTLNSIGFSVFLFEKYMQNVVDSNIT